MHRRSRRRPLAVIALLLACTLVLAACGGDGEDTDRRGGDAGDGPTTSDPVGGGRDDPYVAQVASYELVAGRDQRFLAALAGNGTGLVVSFGAVDLEFFYLGTRAKPIDPPQRVSTAEAAFFPVAGQDVDPATPGPRVARPSEGLGVYAAPGVRFDRAGFWGVRVSATIDGEEVSANAPFEVVAESQL
ncbi:MAG TPA: hypothetical protein VM933_09605, partial [Acidimicrobiales bacterium]|nr:hypothetical protein [Acidimicrobiales bacterium]